MQAQNSRQVSVHLRFFSLLFLISNCLCMSRLVGLFSIHILIICSCLYRPKLINNAAFKASVCEKGEPSIQVLFLVFKHELLSLIPAQIRVYDHIFIPEDSNASLPLIRHFDMIDAFNPHWQYDDMTIEQTLLSSCPPVEIFFPKSPLFSTLLEQTKNVDERHNCLLRFIWYQCI